MAPLVIRASGGCALTRPTVSASAATNLFTGERNLQNAAFGADQPARMLVSECDSPVICHPWETEPGIAFVRRPGGASGTGNDNAALRALPALVVLLLALAQERLR